jgi:rhamnosyltransferase
MKQSLALIITYNPPSGFEHHLEQLFVEFERLILVDNGSSPAAQKMLQDQVELRRDALVLLLNPTNLGVAAALNQGFAWAIQRGFDFIVTLDQDSLPAPGMNETLLNSFEHHPNRRKLAVLAPTIVEELLPHPARYIRSKAHFLFERVTCEKSFLRNVSFAITSGSLYNLTYYQDIGPFRDDFFIDYVDTEYCLRAIARGYEISIACDARLIHHLGKRQKKHFLGREQYPTFHAPFRWYYISRNRVPMLRIYAFHLPHWFFYEIAITLTSFTRMMLFETQRTTKIRAFLIGTLDGLLGKMGEMPEHSRRFLNVS